MTILQVGDISVSSHSNKHVTMRTISNREFVANPEMYLGMATRQEVRVRKGQRVIRLTCEPPATRQPVLEPDDDYRSAITVDELKERMSVSIHKYFADKQ